MKKKCFGRTLYTLSVNAGRTILMPYRATPTAKPIYNNVDPINFPFSKAANLKKLRTNWGGKK